MFHLQGLWGRGEKVPRETHEDMSLSATLLGASWEGLWPGSMSPGEAPLRFSPLTFSGLHTFLAPLG